MLSHTTSTRPPARWRVIYRLSFGLCAALLAGQAAAAAPSPTGTVTLPEAVAAALQGSPDLARFAYDRRVAEARELQAGLRPNPELGVDVENFAGSGAHRAVDSTETTLRLGLILERGGKRDARISAARRATDLVSADYEIARLNVLAQTTSRFVDLVQSQAQLTLAQRAMEYAKDLGAATEKRVTSGAANPVERHRAAIEIERARLEGEHYEHLSATQQRMLAAMWGETEPQFTRAQAELLQLPDVPDYTELVKRLDSSPDFARYDLEQRLREADLGLARAQASTDPSVYGGLRHFNASSDVAMVAYLLMPLPWNNRNQGEIAAAQARRDRLGAERSAQSVRSHTALYEMVQELRHARTLVESLQNTLIPEADAVLRLTRQGYASGRLSQRELIDAQRTRLELEGELITNAADYHRFLAAVDRMTAMAPAELP